MTAAVAFLSFADVSAFLKPTLQARGFTDAVVTPGPANSPIQQKASPGRIVFVTVGGGPGLSYEGTYDRVFIAVRAVGKQRDYDDSQQLAMTVDQALTAVTSPTTVGSVRVLYVVRSGGRPQLLEQDSADRYHHTCSYVTAAATSL